MTTWRLAAAETLLFGDALDDLIDGRAGSDRGDAFVPEERLAFEALRDVGIVRVVPEDIVPPGLAVRIAADGVPSTGIELELVLRGVGDTRRLYWLVDRFGPGGFERSAVDAYSGAPRSRLPRGDEPAAILLTRRRSRGVDLANWSRTLVGQPLSIELGPARAGAPVQTTWQHVVRGRPESLAV